MSFFSKKPSAEELMREQNRNLRRAQRDVEKDRRALERQEKQLELEIKKAAKQGNKQVLTVLAKNLVTVRKQKARTYTATSKIMSVGNQTKAMHSSAKLATTMATTTKTMGLANKELNPQGIMKTMHDFEKESMKMGMAEEIVEDSLNSYWMKLVLKSQERCQKLHWLIEMKLENQVELLLMMSWKDN
ncbi:charged multivesicular body protein 2b [Trichonephila inaurata madagascariensis]|uniref:Charged multivesicular body protein 2b n=1 Tax=Trichonephila inaurata madagascariensis TaxID=2747483 RepID=A0A8X6X8H8_9ARAC|nr:charged multivesicular body protein 2b [Trichonephila inaurata madagascariensis]